MPAVTELMPAVTELRREVSVATSTPRTRADDRRDWKVKRGKLENCTTEPRKIEMLLHDDVMYQILLWLPVVSLLRFKHVCRSWHALIGSNDFIKQHLHHHHHDPNLKDKNDSLIYQLPDKDPPFTFRSVSIDNFEELNSCVQLDWSDLRGYIPPVFEIVSYNGIVCLNLVDHNLEHSICLWNPATKQARVLPQPPALNKVLIKVGFGFDVKSNDYKVVNLIISDYTNEKRIEVYSLNTSSWRSVTAVFPFIRFVGNPSMPFNNGTCFFWLGYNSPKNTGIFCFDFCSEMFCSIPLPHADYFPLLDHVSVVRDEIACIFRINDHQTELWVFKEYGKVNESWIKLYTIDTYSTVYRGMPIEWLSMNGDDIFFVTMDQMCRHNVITKETNCFTLGNMPCSYANKTMVRFKESLVSIGEGN